MICKSGYRRRMAAKASVMAALFAVFSMIPTTASAQSSDTVVQQSGTAFQARANQLVDLFEGRVAYDSFFAPVFQSAVPDAQFQALRASLIAQYGRPLAIESLHSTNGRSGTLRLRFEKAVATVLLDVSSAPDIRVSGLRITDAVAGSDSFDRITAEISALPGRTGFLVAELNGDQIQPLVQIRSDEQFAIGSTFKLYVLDELTAQVEAGKRRWSDVVPLTHLSFSSSATAGWQAKTPVTLQTLANWMISVSDNGATDTLIHLLGRDVIERRIRSAGHSDPSRNEPLLTTVEAFALKGDNFAKERAAFIAGDDQQQRRVLRSAADRLILSNVDGGSFSGKPRFIDSLEWFASPSDIARLMVDLRSRKSDALMDAMAINSGVGPGAAADWHYLGYKGGSELGVLSMSLLGQRKSDKKWVVVTGSWNNNSAPLDDVKFVALIKRLLAQAAN